MPTIFNREHFSIHRLALETWGGEHSHNITEASMIVLQFTDMSYPTNLVLYEDEPAGWIFKFLFVIVTLVLLAGSVYFWVLGNNTSGLTMLVAAFIIGLTFWIVSPRKYQVNRIHLLINLLVSI